jgi:TolB-like protein
MGVPGNGDEDRKLESWKEIAAFFERDLRTVIRWEKELGLPIHRYPGKSKGRVYADVSELRAWADGPRRVAAEAEPTSQTATAIAELDTVVTSDTPLEASGSSFAVARPPRSLIVWLAVAVGVVTILALAGFAYWRSHRGQAISSVAVLPFDNLGEESDPAFVEGLTDEIAASLSRLDGVRVAGRRSAYTFQGKHDELQKVGSALGVEAVVEGSVQRSGDRTHVAVQLNRTRDGFTVWSQTFDGDSRDLIQIESEIATAVARSVSNNANTTVPAPGTSDPEARALYLQGRYLWNQRTLESGQKSVEHMKQAIAKDPNYALAWSGLAESWMTIGNLEEVEPSAYLPQAREAARKALALDPNLAEAHAVLGRIAAHYDYDWSTAESEYQKAFALNPSYATAHQYYALGLMAHGQFAEAQRQLDIARQLDPLALIVGVDVALLRKFQRDYDGVIRESSRVLQLDPNYHVGYSMLATGYFITHRRDEWLHVNAKVPQDPTLLPLVEGHAEEAKQQLAQEAKDAEQGKLPAYRVAIAATRLGETQMALDWLERSYQNHDYWLLFMNVEPEMDSIRAEPRFQAIVKKLGVG